MHALPPPPPPPSKQTMMMFLKSSSSSIHSEQHAETGHDHDQVKKKKEPSSSFTALTVWRKSLIVSCNGFTVIDSFGNLVYRVDNYKGPTKELILMDAAGKSILTMRRRRHKALSLLDSWVVYEGDHDEESDHSRPETAAAAWWVKKCININSVFSTHHAAGVLAQVYRNSGCEAAAAAAAAYVVQGSYGRRSCRVLDESKRVVAEIRRKDDNPGGVSFGLEVFHLVISDGFDPALAMALVLLLDQMFS